MELCLGELLQKLDLCRRQTMEGFRCIARDGVRHFGGGGGGLMLTTVLYFKFTTRAQAPAELSSDSI